MIDFSVLIPVYNAEKFLHQCVNSVLKQTCQNFEIIMVDDGSSDESGKICDEYSKKDSRIHVFHQKNLGPLAARIHAFLHAKGDFVLYLDADDFWDKKLLETIKKVQEEYKCDIVSFQWAYTDESGKPISINRQAKAPYKNYKITDLIIKFLQTETENSLCGRAVRRCYIRMDELDSLKQWSKIYLGEDMLQSFVMIKNCSNAIAIEQTLYYYRMNPESITHNITPQHVYDLATARDILAELLIKSDFQDMMYLAMLHKHFVEQYLTDMVVLAVQYPTSQLRRCIANIRKLTIYSAVDAQTMKRKLPFRRRILYTLEQNNMWKTFIFLAKVFHILKH